MRSWVAALGLLTGEDGEVSVVALTGGDPFLGEEFLSFWEEWDSRGRPGYTPTQGSGRPDPPIDCGPAPRPPPR